MAVRSYCYLFLLTLLTGSKHELAEPFRRVPAGTKIVLTGAFDNSAQNPTIPTHRSKSIGEKQSWEEMFMGFYTWKNVEQGWI